MARKWVSSSDRRRVTAKRLKEIAGLAHQLWFEFARRRQTKPEYKGFLANGELLDAQTPLTLNVHAEAFFNFCVEKTLGVDDGTIVLARLFRPSKASVASSTAGKRSDGKSAPSWLYHRQWRVAWMVLDLHQLDEQTQGGHEARRKIATRLILHEAGHVVLHFLKLRTRKKTGIRPAAIGGALRGVPSVNEAQEEEAWVFCGIILGLALGQMARRSRPKHVDRAWPRSC
jgi:hypothetical protein